MPVNGLGWDVTRQATPQDYQDAERARAEAYAQRNAAPAMPAPQQVAQVPLVTGNPGYKPPVFDARALYGQPAQVPAAAQPQAGQGFMDWLSGVFGGGQAAAQPQASVPAAQPAQTSQNKLGLLGTFGNPGGAQRAQSAEAVQQLFADTSKGLPDGRYVERMVATGPGTFTVMRLPAEGASLAGTSTTQTSAPEAASMPRPLTIIRGGQKQLVDDSLGLSGAASSAPTQGAAPTQQPADPYAQYNQILQQMQKIIGGGYEGNAQQLPALAEMGKLAVQRGNAAEVAAARSRPSARDTVLSEALGVGRQIAAMEGKELSPTLQAKLAQMRAYFDKLVTLGAYQQPSLMDKYFSQEDR